MHALNAEFDAVIKVAARTLLDEDVEYARSIDTSDTVISKKAYNRIRHKIKRFDRASLWGMLPLSCRRIVAAVLCICTIAFCVCMSITPVRAEFAKIWMQIYEKFASVFYVSEKMPPEFIEEYLGMRVESVDEVEIIRRMTQGIYDEAEYQKALKWTREKCKEGFDKNPEQFRRTDEQKEQDWEFVVKMMCIIKDLMNGNKNLPAGCEEEAVGHNAIAAGFQGQRQWTDFYPNCDFPEAMLNTSFDWNGAREPYILATENDVLNGLGMLFMKLLTNRAQIFADVRTYWSPEAVKKATGYELEGVAKQSGGFIHLINSGAACLDACGKATDENGNGVMKPWYDVTDKDIDNILDATTWNYADLGYFRGGGYSSRFVTEAEMPCTMIRLNLVKGLGPVLQIAEGWTVHLPDEVSDKLWKRTDYTWPCTWFAPRTTGEGAFKTAYDVMNNWGANHGAISYGHIGADLITLCSMLRIPVAMHNVPEKDIFRPAAWNAFGMDKEGQDFRACNAYGPMYRNIR